MQRFTKRRVSAVAGAMVVVTALCLGSIGLATAGAGAAPSSIHAAHIQAANSHPSTFTGGTYNLFINGSASGTITFNADNSWTLSDYTDVGSWVVVGKTISLGDTVATESSNGSVWSAAVEKKGKGFGTKKKPGIMEFGGGGSPGGYGSNSWYATPEP
jgi:hypothetical protein